MQGLYEGTEVYKICACCHMPCFGRTNPDIRLVLYDMCPFSAIWLQEWEATSPEICGRTGPHLFIPAKVSLWAQPNWNVLGICQIVSWNQFYLYFNTQALLGYGASTDGKFKTAKALVPQCLDSCDLVTIHHFFWKTWHYLDAYE